MSGCAGRVGGQNDGGGGGGQKQHRCSVQSSHLHIEAAAHPIDRTFAANIGCPSDLVQQQRMAREASQLFCDPEVALEEGPDLWLW
jgi:hypothetical protein